MKVKYRKGDKVRVLAIVDTDFGSTEIKLTLPNSYTSLYAAREHLKMVEPVIEAGDPIKNENGTRATLLWSDGEGWSLIKLDGMFKPQLVNTSSLTRDLTWPEPEEERKPEAPPEEPPVLRDGVKAAPAEEDPIDIQF